MSATLEIPRLEVPDPQPPEAPTRPPGGPEIPGDPTPPEQPAETPPAPEVPDPEPPVEPEPGEPDVPSPDPTGPEIPEDPQPPEPAADPPAASRAESTPKQSDQLPEEGPAEQVPDDVGEALGGG